MERLGEIVGPFPIALPLWKRFFPGGKEVCGCMGRGREGILGTLWL